MKTIKFKTTEFPITSFTATADRFQASIIKGDRSVDAIINEATGSTQFKVSEDGITIGVYNGYTKLFVVALMRNVKYNDDYIDLVSVEFTNDNIQDQINRMSEELNNKINTIESTQTIQANTISSISSTVSVLSETQALQDEAIEDLGTVVSDISEAVVPTTENEESEG